MKRRVVPESDFLDEMVAERARTAPDFPQLVDAAYERRKLLRKLASARARAGVSQTELAAKMKTSQSSIARLEAGGTDARMSTVDRFAIALGKRVKWDVVARPRRAIGRRRRA